MKYLFLTLGIIVFSSLALSQHHDWKISLDDGSKISNAALTSMNDDSLIVESDGQSHAVSVSHINKIERRVSPPSTVLGGILGAAVGAGLGYLASDVIGLGGSTTNPYTGSKTYNSTGAFMGGGAVLGALVGAGVGSSTGMETYDLRNKSNQGNLALCQSLVQSEGGSSSSSSSQRQFIHRDIVHFKNGTTMSGEIVPSTEDSTMILQVDKGVQYVYHLNEIDHVEKDTAFTEVITPKVPKKFVDTYDHAESGPAIPPALLFSAGIGFPMEPSGFKDSYISGVNGEIGIEVHPSSQVALVFAFGYNNFPFDGDKLISQGKAAGLTISNVSGGSATIITVTAASKIRFVQPERPFSPFISFGAGYFNVGVEDLTFSYTTSSGSGTLRLTSNNEGAFDMQIGLGGEYATSASIALVGQLAYNLGFTSGQATHFLPVRVGVKVGL